MRTELKDELGADGNNPGRGPVGQAMVNSSHLAPYFVDGHHEDADREDAGQFITMIAERYFSHIPNEQKRMMTAMENIADVQEELGAPANNCRQANGNDGDGTKSVVVTEKFARFLVESKNPMLDIRLFFYALNSSALDDVLNHKVPADFARQCDCTRANATKRLEEIQVHFNLPIREGQRDEVTRENFKKTQKQIWEKASKK